MNGHVSRRQLLAGGLVVAALPFGTLARALPVSQKAAALSPALLRDALEALQHHQSMIPNTDYIGIADFSLPSWKARFHIVNLADGQSRTLLVAHGRGSDPAHKGWLQSFSNLPGSNATSSGVYLTGAEYEGQHGLSRRLIGLTPDNSNAVARAIVIHSAWYVSRKMVAVHGKVGRSEGCFVFDEADLSAVMSQLGSGRMIYAAKPTV